MVKLHIYKYVIEDGYKVAKVYKRLETTRFNAFLEIKTVKSNLGMWYAGSIIKRKI